MAIKYVDREGKVLAPQAWKEKAADPAYSIVRQYDNGVVQVTLKWSGRVTTPDTFSEYWPVFILLVKNYKADGTLANDPAEGDNTYPTEAAGIKAYEEFLARWTECELDNEGTFVEEGNVLTPPPPPDPNKPMSEPEGLEGGAW